MARGCGEAGPAVAGAGGGGGERAGAEASLDALLARTEALQLGSLEADRARLIAVAERLVQLGASVSARRVPSLPTLCALSRPSMWPR